MVNEVKSPKEFYGFEMGTDRKLARWDKIVEYFNLLDEESDRIKVEVVGETTEENPFILATISSSENLAELDKYKEISKKLADPRALKPEEVEELIEEGKAVIAITCSLHATEVGSCQMSSELAYELITSNSEEIKQIRDEVIFLLVPSFNPDGQIMVTDYYNEYLGTKYEGLGLPWLSHKYVGHDTNRDAYMFNMPESRHFAKIMFHDWVPQAYIDHHHMTSYTFRFYVSPWMDPISENVNPMLWREHLFYGSYQALRLEEAGKTGVETSTPYFGWWMSGFSRVGDWHNICSMLTESASAKIATPIYIHMSQLTTGSRETRGPAYEATMNLPHPWLGGWWRLRDIVEQVKISSLATLEAAAKNRKWVLRNMVLKASRQTERGKAEPPFAFIVPENQHDPLTAVKLLQVLRIAEVEIHQVEEPFESGGVVYPEGTYIIFTAQPKRAYVVQLFKRTFYPDNQFTRYRDGAPQRPYDLCTFNLNEFMGVNVVTAEERFEGKFVKVEEIEFPRAVVGTSPNGYMLSCKYNDSFTAVNRLLKEGLKVRRTKQTTKTGDKTFEPGAFYIPGGKGINDNLSKLAEDLHLNFYAVEEAPESFEVKPLKAGMYKRYWGGNKEEGWQRWVLEQFEFPYSSVMDNEIKGGDLNTKYDVLILPTDLKALIIGEKELEEHFNKKYFGAAGSLTHSTSYPPKYRSGIGEDGVEKLKEFVRKGGTLIACNQAHELVIDEFDLPVETEEEKAFKTKLPIENAVKDLDPKEFFCPGSTLKVRVDPHHPLAYGMPKDGLILFRDSPAFNILRSDFNERYQAVVSYPVRDILQSGRLIGEKHLSRKAALVDIKYGEGRIVLIGFQHNFRGTMHGTFKFLFNALLG